jgi:hypothetical protein
MEVGIFDWCAAVSSICRKSSPSVSRIARRSRRVIKEMQHNACLGLEAERDHGT